MPALLVEYLIVQTWIHFFVFVPCILYQGKTQTNSALTIRSHQDTQLSCPAYTSLYYCDIILVL